MTSVPPRRRNQRAREAGRRVTLFEIVNAVAILAIVSLTMIFAFGGVMSRSALALCQQEGSTVATAILKYDTSNPHTPLTNANFVSQLTTTASRNVPFLDAWPSNFPHYAFTVINGTLWVFTGNSLTATTPPIATALTTSHLTPGSLRPDNVLDSTANWINYDAYGPDACAGVQ